MADAEARARYPMIEKTDWEALGYDGLQIDRALRGTVVLEGEIHDLFKFQIAGKPMRTWSQQTPQQYRLIEKVLEPVFRLATNFLLSPASLDWFYYLIYAPRALTDPPIQHNGDDVYVYHRDDAPMEKRHEMARAALQRLAMTHTITLEDLVDDDHDDEGRTMPRIDDFFEQGVNIKDDSSRISGIRPHIAMSRAFVRDVIDMCMDGSQSLWSMHVVNMKMAVAWIHEIAHGAAMASDLRRLNNVKKELSLRANAAANHIQRERKAENVNEDLFEDENVAEPGYSWENFVFGGIIELHDDNPTNPLLFIAWPNFLKGNRDLRKGGWKPSATQYFVPRQYILNVNSQKWWDKVEKNDTTALYIKKIIGIRVDCPNPDEIDSDLSPSDSSEREWPTDEQRNHGKTKSKRVSRMVGGLAILDPSNAKANELAK